jgi:hypothetical protein
MLLTMPALAKSATTVLASYVIWSAGASQPIPVARFILQGAATGCPQARGSDGQSIRVVARDNPHPSTFPVTVCEAVAPADGILILPDGTRPALPIPAADPRNVVTLGDSGCRTVSGGQPCDSGAWPLPDLARQMKAERPDLLIHLGDFNYRGSPGTVGPDAQPVYDGCTGDTGNQNAPGSAQWDGWTTWQLDVFQPLQHLLSKVAMAPVRGNHELCSRTGPGWFYFLDPGSALVDPAYRQPDCPQVVASGMVDTTPPQVLSFPKLTLVTMDTADACDFGIQANQAAAFGAQFKVLAQAAPAKPVWLLTHRPIWALTGLTPDGAGGNTPSSMVTAVLQKTALANKFDSWAGLVMSGHVHNMGALDFSNSWPLQLILGNGGVKLLTLDLPESYPVTIDGVHARGIYGAFFGYASFSYCGQSWQGALRSLTSSAPLPSACSGTLLAK